MARRLFGRRASSYDSGRGFGAPEFRNAERDLFLFRRRLVIAGACALLAFAGLFGRFFYLQVVQHEHYRTLADSNRIAVVPIVPNRGVITDRNGVVLATNYSAYTLEITPSRAGTLDDTIDELSKVVEIQTRSGDTSGRRRSTVAWRSERSPSRARNCLGRWRRLDGQKRVPEPPARMRA